MCALLLVSVDHLLLPENRTRLARDSDKVLVMAGLGMFLFLGMVSLAGRSLLVLAGMMGLILSLSSKSNPRQVAEILRSSLSAYLPFIALVLVIAPFQEKATDTLWMVSIPASFILARSLRHYLRIQSFLAAVGFVGLVLGAVYLFSQLEMSELIPTVGKLAEYHHKNGVGWTLAFACVSFTTLSMSGSSPSSQRLAYGCLGVFSAVAMVFVSSVTSLLATVAALGLYLVLRTAQIIRARNRLHRKVSLFLPLAVIMFLSFALIAANMSQAENVNLSSLLGRDTSLTGRTELWRCYLEGRSAGTNEIGPFVSECSGISVGSLHSSFLEADRYGGPVLALSLLLGFLFAISAAVRKVLLAEGDQATDDAAFSLMFAVVGFVIATVESYVFSGFVYISILVFLAPSRHDFGKLASFRKRLRPRNPKVSTRLAK